MIVALAATVIVALPGGGGPHPTGADRARVLREYHDSGDYRRDVGRIARPARRWVLAHADGDRPALVLDVDETALSNYPALAAGDFKGGAAARYPSAVRPVLRLYRSARRRRVAVFFVTGRDEPRRAETVRALRRAGYRGWAGLTLEPSGSTLSATGFKARARRRIERRGYRIVANVGDQYSDVEGGHALRAFKLANPFYTIQ